MELIKDMWNDGWQGRLMLAFLIFLVLLIPAAVQASTQFSRRGSSARSENRTQPNVDSCSLKVSRRGPLGAVTIFVAVASQRVARENHSSGVSCSAPALLGRSSPAARINGKWWCSVV